PCNVGPRNPSYNDVCETNPDLPHLGARSIDQLFAIKIATDKRASQRSALLLAMWVGRISASGCKELTEDTAMDAKVANVCFANRLKEYGHLQALRFEEGPSLTYEALTARVDQFARTLGPDRQLLLLETDTSLESIVAYLAALAIRNPVILVSPDQ